MRFESEEGGGGGVGAGNLELSQLSGSNFRISFRVSQSSLAYKFYLKVM